MQCNDFLISLNSKRINILEDETTIPEFDYEEQIKILISSETNPEIRAGLYEYWQKVSRENNFDRKLFVQDLIDKRFSFY